VVAPGPITDKAPYGSILSTSLVTQNFFDEDGNLVKTIDPRGIETDMIYDQDNRLTMSRELGSMPRRFAMRTTHGIDP
jgi:YD repeat-containing protein